MKSILLTALLALGACNSNVENTSLKSDSESLIPEYGMSCKSEDGYSLSLYPKLENNMHVEFELLDSENNLVDDNFYLLGGNSGSEGNKNLTYEDGVVEISIEGLKTQSVTDANILYNNDVLDMKLTFNQCDII